MQDNPHSSDLLEVKSLKEVMAFEFTEVQRQAGIRLNLERWFRRWQEFGNTSNEPLTELLIYAFLPERGSETRTFYADSRAPCAWPGAGTLRLAQL